MLNNAPVKAIEHGNLTIEGYSRAAVQSYWRVPELKLGFDLGAHPWDFMGVPTWMLSHTHLDHVAALPLYVSRRRLMKMEPPRVILPERSIPDIERMLRSFERLDRGRLPCELIGVVDGDEVELSRELVVRAVRTTHTINSLGYMVFERRKKLKPEFADLTPDQIRDIRLSGQEVSEERRLPLVGYTGDTTPAGLDENPEFYEMKILITEMTFVDPEHQKHLIHKHGHMHLDDFVERQDRFQNELIIAGHLSTRYTTQQVKRHVKKKLPGMLDGRLVIWL